MGKAVGMANLRKTVGYSAISGRLLCERRSVGCGWLVGCNIDGWLVVIQYGRSVVILCVCTLKVVHHNFQRSHSFPDFRIKFLTFSRFICGTFGMSAWRLYAL